MSVKEIQTAIVELPQEELANLLDWIEEYRLDQWDRQIAQDVESGHFDALRQRVREQRQAGLCQPLRTTLLRPTFGDIIMHSQKKCAS